jgi:chromosome partitioning protein
LISLKNTFTIFLFHVLARRMLRREQEAGMILGVLNQKGGVGKTTIAIHMAAALAQERRRVLLLDADPQGSALDWDATRTAKPLFTVMGKPKAALHRDIDALAAQYDDVVIDGPPRVYDVTRSAALASDVVLIPVQPSPYDVWAAKEIVELVKEASSFKDNLKSVFIISRKIVNTAIGRDVKDALTGYPFPVLETTISQRVAFAESAAQGLTVLETDPKGLGAREIRALLKEIRKGLP